MTNTKTERRLAITPGEAKHYGNGYVEVRRGERKAIRFNPEGYTPGQPGFVQSVDDATLYADAHNTYNACHLTPSEMLAELTKLRSERDELVGALRRMTDRASEIGQPAVDAMDGEDFHLLADAISMSREVLSKHKPE